MCIRDRVRIASPLAEKEVEAYRADAKAEGDNVCIGGWEVMGWANPAEARWFSIRLTKKNASWVFDGGEPFRKIASLELLGTLLCVLAFPPEGVGKSRMLTLTAMTDNQGNAAALSKMMTTKFPLCAVMMEIASTVAKQKIPLRLHWTPREQNVEADELSNEKFHRFDPKKRVDVLPLLSNFRLFNKMIKLSLIHI